MHFCKRKMVVRIILTRFMCPYDSVILAFSYSWGLSVLLFIIFNVSLGSNGLKSRGTDHSKYYSSRGLSTDAWFVQYEQYCDIQLSRYKDNVGSCPSIRMQKASTEIAWKSQWCNVKSWTLCFLVYIAVYIFCERKYLGHDSKVSVCRTSVIADTFV